MKKLALTLAAAAALTAGSVQAQDFNGQLKARQGQFRILAINLGILGAMAKGEAEYNAEAASASADSIVAVSMIHQGPLWPEGSDNGAIEGTRALPSIWANNDDFLAKWSALGTAAMALQAVAGDGQAGLGAGLGQVGGACQACHEAHRAPAN